MVEHDDSSVNESIDPYIRGCIPGKLAISVSGSTLSQREAVVRMA